MKSKHDWTTTLILCFVGFHPFYVGKIGTGILQWLTGFGLGIWWLIDIIAIVSGKFTDSEGKIISKDTINFGNLNNSTQNITAADEIKKFKELLDAGAINQEEFDKKKKELLK